MKCRAGCKPECTGVQRALQNPSRATPPETPPFAVHSPCANRPASSAPVKMLATTCVVGVLTCDPSQYSSRAPATRIASSSSLVSICGGSQHIDGHAQSSSQVSEHRLRRGYGRQRTACSRQQAWLQRCLMRASPQSAAMFRSGVAHLRIAKRPANDVGDGRCPLLLRNEVHELHQVQKVFRRAPAERCTSTTQGQ